MTAWTDACPICARPISAHNEVVARAHYERWLQNARESSIDTLYWDDQPMLVGEYDEVTQRIFHRAAR